MAEPPTTPRLPASNLARNLGCIVIAGAAALLMLVWMLMRGYAALAGH